VENLVCFGGNLAVNCTIIVPVKCERIYKIAKVI